MGFYDKVRRQKFLSFSLILFTLAIGILIGTVVQTGAKAAREQQAAPDATPLTVPNETPMQNEFSKIAKRLEPSVVNISTEYIPKRQTSSNRQSPNLRRRGQQAPQDDDQPDDNGMQGFLQRFFGGGGGGQQFQFGEPDVPSAATGSGVVVDPNGYIITNNHVVEKATKIKVKFMKDSTEYPATVIGTDPDTDIAVVHIEKKGLPAAKIGNSDALQVGDWAMAIGSPFGFQATVTAGIISALSRDIPDNDNPGRTFQHFIQTDAAINPGNSGGPLLNTNGEVIGINTMIASRSGGYQGIGFAMPVNMVAKVYNQIIREGHVTRGSIGITFDANDNPSLLSVYGAEHGVFVTKVEPNGPAEKAGVKVEDVITAINGKPIKTGQDLIDMVAESSIGSTLKLGIVRNKKPISLDITVGDRQRIFASLYGGGKQSPEKGPEGAQLKFGISVSPIRPSDREQMGFKAEGGVQITDVEEGSFAYDLGLQRGDVITELNRQPINSTDDLRRIQASLKPGDSVAFHIMRQTGGLRGGGDWVSFFPAGKVPEGN